MPPSGDLPSAMMNQLPPPTTAPAGWYPDPWGQGVRYFDGTQWTPYSNAFQEHVPHPTLPMRAAVGALVILVASLVVGKALIEILIDFDWPVILYVVILASIGYGPSVAWCWYVRRRWGSDTYERLGWRFRWSDLGWGPLAYLSAIFIQVLVALAILALDIPFTSNLDDGSDIGVDRLYLIATVVTAVVAAPLVEELVFRGVVMRGFLSRLPPVVAIVLQGVLFGAAHVDPVRGTGNVGLVIVLSTVGVVFGAVAYWLRRIGATVVTHAIYNGVAMLVVLSGWFDDVDSPFDSWVRVALHAAGIDR